MLRKNSSFFTVEETRVGKESSVKSDFGNSLDIFLCEGNAISIEAVVILILGGRLLSMVLLKEFSPFVQSDC